MTSNHFGVPPVDRIRENKMCFNGEKCKIIDEPQNCISGFHVKVRSVRKHLGNVEV